VPQPPCIVPRSIAAGLLAFALACDSSPPGADSTAKSNDEMNDKTSDKASPNAAKPAEPVTLHPKLAGYVDEVLAQIDSVPAERRKQLDKLALFVKTKRDSGEVARLVFICTHNSRRSHLSQLWAAVAAAHYGLGGIETFSGGTEATAFNPRAVAALERAGFEITAPEQSDNPRYAVSFGPDAPPLQAFSKKYSDAPNPKDNFAAIMTCTDADKSCPMVEGASLRVPIPYVDPKAADDTPEEAAAYDERARQIAVEMFYLFSRVTA
jgi:arsenate reductase (thioredoxin)